MTTLYSCLAYACGLGAVLLSLAQLWNLLQNLSHKDMQTQGTFGLFLWSVQAAIFAGAFAGWICCYRNGVPGQLAILIRVIGGLSAIGLFVNLGVGSLSVLAVIGYASYAVLWWVAERSNRIPAHSYYPSIASLSGCLLVAAFLILLVTGQLRHHAIRNAYAKFAEERMSTNQPNDVREPQAVDLEDSDLQYQSSGIEEPLTPVQSISKRREHRLGPSSASKCFVLYFDYGNQECIDLYRTLVKLQSNRSDVALVLKHYPEVAAHTASIESIFGPEACREVLIAEATAEAAGEEAFWKIHDWIVEQDAIDEAVLRSQIELLGVNYEQFSSCIGDTSLLSGVLEDVMSARLKGATKAPSLWLNGQLVSTQGVPLLEEKLAGAIAADTPDRASAESKVDTALPREAAAEIRDLETQFRVLFATVRVVNPSNGAVGSGTVVGKRGDFLYVLTANHLVENSAHVEVQTFTKEAFPNFAKEHQWCSTVAAAPRADLAILRFKGDQASPVPVQIAGAENPKIAIPQKCLTFGCNAGEAFPRVVPNVILDVRSIARIPEAVDCLCWRVEQSSVPGRSGGAMVNFEGELVGVASGNSGENSYFSHHKEILSLLDRVGIVPGKRD